MATKDQFKANNHFIPQMFMSAWADDEGRIWQYRLLVSNEGVPTWTPSSIRRTASYPFLYSSMGKKGKTDMLERWFDQQVEQPAITPLEKARRGETLSVGETKGLARFILAQDLRTPASFIAQASSMMEIQDEVLRTTLNDIANELGKGPLPTSKSDLLVGQDREDSVYLPIGVRIDPCHETGNAIVSARSIAGKHSWLLQCQRSVENLWPHVAKQDWSVVVAPKGLRWPLTDRPVVKARFNSLADFDLKGAWGIDATDILFPVSPTQLLMCSIGRPNPFENNAVLPPTLARLYVLLICKNAHRAIMMPNDDRNIPGIRPRRVDRTQYIYEKTQFEQLDEQETKAIEDLEMWLARDSSTGQVEMPNE